MLEVLPSSSKSQSYENSSAHWISVLPLIDLVFPSAQRVSWNLRLSRGQTSAQHMCETSYAGWGAWHPSVPQDVA